jgi:hypothetical protein
MFQRQAEQQRLDKRKLRRHQKTQELIKAVIPGLGSIQSRQFLVFDHLLSRNPKHLAANLASQFWAEQTRGMNPQGILSRRLEQENVYLL